MKSLKVVIPSSHQFLIRNINYDFHLTGLNYNDLRLELKEMAKLKTRVIAVLMIGDINKWLDGIEITIKKVRRV